MPRPKDAGHDGGRDPGHNGKQGAAVRSTAALRPGLYVHVPFCEKLCHYCDFNTYLLRDGGVDEYLSALEREIALYAGARPSASRHPESPAPTPPAPRSPAPTPPAPRSPAPTPPAPRSPAPALFAPASPGSLPSGAESRLDGDVVVEPNTQFATVFIGGGTPTALTAPQLGRLVQSLRDGFAIAEDAEITIEANPGTLIDSRLRALREAGVNRLSIGVQSLNDDLLRVLGRIHNARQARDCYERARDMGFDNISVDLMFGLPDQDVDDWRRTLEEVASWGPDHLSCYSLIIEDGTPFAEWHRRGLLALPGEDAELAMYRLTMDHLAALGYEHYEIANWARPGKQSRHNRIYWLNGQWLGLGPGAHSQWGGKRFANVLLPEEYGAATAQGVRPVASTEEIPRKMAMEDTLMLGLRLLEGVDGNDFQRRFGVSLRDEFGREIDQLVAAGLLKWRGQHLALTRDGLFVANQVFQRFIR